MQHKVCTTSSTAASGLFQSLRLLSIFSQHIRPSKETAVLKVLADILRAVMAVTLHYGLYWTRSIASVTIFKRLQKTYNLVLVAMYIDAMPHISTTGSSLGTED